MLHKIAVYGSLMKGHGNHRVLAEGGARFLCRFVTRAQFQMYDLGAFPGVTAGGERIHAELYLVDDATLRRLDLLEGHPNFYRRTEIAPGVEMYILQRGPSMCPAVPGGNWRTYYVQKTQDALQWREYGIYGPRMHSQMIARRVSGE